MRVCLHQTLTKQISPLIIAAHLTFSHQGFETISNSKVYFLHPRNNFISPDIARFLSNQRSIVLFLLHAIRRKFPWEWSTGSIYLRGLVTITSHPFDESRFSTRRLVICRASIFAMSAYHCVPRHHEFVQPKLEETLLTLPYM